MCFFFLKSKVKLDHKLNCMATYIFDDDKQITEIINT